MTAGPVRYLVLSIAFSAIGACALARQATDERAAKPERTARAGVNGVGAPQCIHCPQPSYTDKARAVNFNGIVLLDVKVTKDGRVEDPKVSQGPAGLGLNEKAIATVLKWKMKPASGAEGKPVDCRVQIEVTFQRYVR